METIFNQNSIIVFMLVMCILIALRLVLFIGVGKFLVTKFSDDNLKIQSKIPKKETIRKEIIHTGMTSIINFFIITFIYILFHAHLNKIYTNVNDYSISWLLISPIVLVILHDTYLYWVHRFMHIPRVFKYVHSHHHKSHVPNLWSGFSFHPYEAILEGSYLILVTTFIPINPWAAYVWIVIMNIQVFYIHNGYEFHKKGFSTNPITKNFITSTHHDLHHSKGGNYGLYFTFWDRICGTTNPEYHNVFEKVAKNPSIVNTLDVKTQ